MTTPSKGEQLRAATAEIRTLITRLHPGSVRTPEPEKPKIERWPDGTPKDRVVALEEKINLERARVDPKYYSVPAFDRSGEFLCQTLCIRRLRRRSNDS